MSKYNELNDNSKEQTIRELYVVKKQSFQQIAEQLGTYSNKIRRDAIKFKIPIRDKQQAQKNALKNGTHKHPTKGTQRSEQTKNKIGKGVLDSWESLTAQEVLDRKNKAKAQWDKLSNDQKENMINKANQAVRNSSKTGSKLEKFLTNKLLSDGYKIDFHKEQLLSNTRLQIDIFIPSLNIAIEVDGPSHFLPVWGEDALNRNIKYDNKKTGLILGKGCAMIRIKQTKDFSKSRALLVYEKLLDTLKNIEKKFPDINNRIIEIGD